MPIQHLFLFLCLLCVLAIISVTTFFFHNDSSDYMQIIKNITRIKVTILVAYVIQ